MRSRRFWRPRLAYTDKTSSDELSRLTLWRSSVVSGNNPKIQRAILEFGSLLALFVPATFLFPSSSYRESAQGLCQTHRRPEITYRCGVALVSHRTPFPTDAGFRFPAHGLGLFQQGPSSYRP